MASKKKTQAEKTASAAKNKNSSKNTSKTKKNAAAFLCVLQVLKIHCGRSPNVAKAL